MSPIVFVVTALVAVLAAFALLVLAKRVGNSPSPASRTVRRALKKLPVLREPATQRLLAIGGFVDRRCERCDYFNLEAGQRAMQAHSPFAQAAQFLSPAQMGRPPRDAEGNFLEQPPEVVTLDWASIGACSLHNEGRAKTDRCEKWR